MGEGHYLAGLDLRGRKVVVVGGGSVAQRRLPNLIAAGADVHVIAVDPRPTVEAEPAVTVHRRAWADGDLTRGELADAWYVLACTDDPAVNAAVAAEAAAQRIFCVRADDAAGGSAWTPATGTVDGLIVGVVADRDPHRSARARTAAVAAVREL